MAMEAADIYAIRKAIAPLDQGKVRGCCLPMAVYRAAFPVPTKVTIKKYPGDPGTDLPKEEYCRWCGKKIEVENPEGSSDGTSDQAER